MEWSSANIANSTYQCILNLPSFLHFYILFLYGQDMYMCSHFRCALLLHHMTKVLWKICYQMVGVASHFSVFIHQVNCPAELANLKKFNTSSKDFDNLSLWQKIWFLKSTQKWGLIVQKPCYFQSYSSFILSWRDVGLIKPPQKSAK